MKTHPFFEGIDWKEISTDEYTGLLSLVSQIIPHKDQINEPDSRMSMNCAVGQD
jgi:hypothetical protein